MNHLELYAPEISDRDKVQRDAEACQALWLMVVKRAVLDLTYLDRMAGCANPEKHELEHLHRIAETSPSEFFDSEWFELICDWLELDAGWIRREMGQKVERAV